MRYCDLMDALIADARKGDETNYVNGGQTGIWFYALRKFVLKDDKDNFAQCIDDLKCNINKFDTYINKHIGDESLTVLKSYKRQVLDYMITLSADELVVSSITDICIKYLNYIIDYYYEIIMEN